MSRRDPTFDMIAVNPYESQVAPNLDWCYKNGGEIIAYVKGHNGHYYLLWNGYNRCHVKRMYRSNQIGWSNDYIPCHPDLLNEPAVSENGRPSKEVLEAFLKTVIDHRPFHYVAQRPDRQRSAVYKWERHILLLDFYMPIDKAVEMTYKIVNSYNLPVHEDFVVKAARANNNWSGRAKGSWQIQLAGEVCRKSTLVHELAHILNHGRMVKNKEGGHGPSFVGTVIAMYEVLCGGTTKDMMDLAEQLKVKVSLDAYYETKAMFAKKLLVAA